MINKDTGIVRKMYMKLEETRSFGPYKKSFFSDSEAAYQNLFENLIPFALS